MIKSLYSLLLVVIPNVAFAQTSYPMLMSLEPVAAQLGETYEHTLEARYSMFGFDQVLVSGEGVQGEIITPMELDKNGKEPSLTKIKIRFTVAANASEGVRDFRVVGPTGASTLGQLVITRQPVVSETAKNDTLETATKITVPTTICGVVEKSEDVDLFQFHLDAPTTLVFHVLAMRLQDKIHDLQQHADPIITIRNSSGSTVSAADNVYAADPLLSHTFTEAGDYYIELRDVRYQGNRYWQYAIEVGADPFVRTVHPLAVQTEQNSSVQLIGTNLGDLSAVDAPQFAATTSGVQHIQLTTQDRRLNPVQLYATHLPVVAERLVVPSDSEDPEQEISIPGVIAGKIESTSDIDRYRFAAKKGERMTFEVLARRLNSSLDSILWVSNADGRSLKENDDLRLWGKRTYQDSMIEDWAVPADGDYFINLRDVHLRGGDAFTYVLKATRAEPDFELVLDTDKTQLTPGTAGAIFVRAVRKNGFAGEIALSVENLPPGVIAHCGRIPPAQVDGCIVLEAGEAKPGAVSNITVHGTSTWGEGDDAVEISVKAQSMQETYMPGGGRSHWPVGMHTVAVAAKTDLVRLELDQTDVQLTPGESVKIGVSIERPAGFDKNVTLDMLFQHLSSKFANTLPKGVTIDGKQSKTLLTGKESSGHITLTAAKDAPAIEKQQCCVMANVSINFVMKATYASEPVFVSVVTESE